MGSPGRSATKAKKVTKVVKRSQNNNSFDVQKQQQHYHQHFDQDNQQQYYNKRNFYQNPRSYYTYQHHSNRNRSNSNKSLENVEKKEIPPPVMPSFTNDDFVPLGNNKTSSTEVKKPVMDFSKISKKLNIVSPDGDKKGKDEVVVKTVV